MERTSTQYSERALLAALQRLLALPAHGLTETLDAVADQLAATFHADKVDSFLHDGAEHLLVARGTSDTPMGQLQQRLNLHRHPIAQGGRLVEVWRSGEPYLTGRADLDPEVDRGTREALGVRSLMMAPLAHEGRCFGVLVVAAAREEQFGPGALALLESIAHWVSNVAARAALAEALHSASVREARRAVAEEILAVLAHDLHNYLLPLQARVHALHRRARREGRAQDERDAHEARAATAHLAALVNSLLDSARLTQGLFTLRPTFHDLAAALRELASLLGGERATIELEAPEPLFLLADEGQLRQALSNLLINALQHAPTGSRVRVTACCEQREGADWAVVTIHNGGEPIDPALLPTIFELFTTGNEAPGMGVGLYVAQQVVEQHGGTLGIRSDGGGTTFTLAIPFGAELPVGAPRRGARRTRAHS